MNKKDILFPYDELRKGQEDFIRDVNTTINFGGNLLANVPTGVGKTVSVLGPLLSFVLNREFTGFFLTPKHSQHKIAIDTLRQIKEKYKLNFNAVDFIGKKFMCGQDGVQILSNGEFHEFCRDVREKGTCSFYNKCGSKKDSVEKEVLVKKLKEIGPLHVEEVNKYCIEAGFCPFEIAALLAKDSKFIIADYYHVLSSGVRDAFFTKTNKSLGKSILVFDEGHNIISRTRDLMTSNLSTFILDNAIKEAKNFHYDEYEERLEELKEKLEELNRNRLSVEINEVLVKKNDFVFDGQLVQDFSIIADEVRDVKKRSFIGLVGAFLESWPGDDRGYARILNRGFLRSGKVNIGLNYRCLDPSMVTKKIINDAHSTIVMSGTLVPLQMYKDLLGFDDCKMMEYDNPFPDENRMNIVVPSVSTKFTHRSEDMYRRIANEVVEVANSVPGNIAVFFPSYSLLKEVDKFSSSMLNKTIFYEVQGMNKEEKSEVLEKFKSYKDHGGVLFGVSGGSFSEGIDLIGDYLKGVIVVGLPLAKPDVETKELINYYDDKFSKGWEYGYILPAMTKAIQAAGRCIRSETDKGVIIFLDERYAWDMYSKCFPKDWDVKITKLPKERVVKFFGM